MEAIDPLAANSAVALTLLQRVPAGAEGGVCLVEAALPDAGEAGHQSAAHQRLALPAVPVPCHHVTLALQPHAGVPR